MSGGGEHGAGDSPERLRAGLTELGLALTDGQQRQLLDYLALLGQWNRVYNLTALRDPAQMLTHHVFDSLAVIEPLRRYLHQFALKAKRTVRAEPVEAGAQGFDKPCTELVEVLSPNGCDTHKPTLGEAAQDKAQPLQLLDVGSGGGLPGVVIAICQPDVTVTCVDAAAKKAAFIQQAAGVLRLPNLTGLHARVESLAGPFDIITARAFASLADFTMASRGALAEGGVWLAMKGQRPDAEIAALPPSVEVFHVEQITVPGLDAQRCLVWLRPQGKPND